MSELVFLLVSIILAFPLWILLIESIAAILPSRRDLAVSLPGEVRCGVLIPAHNEEATIAETIKGLLRQLRPQDRLVVVADNCEDATEEKARTLGATVIVREDPTRRGKGYALDFGIRYLESDPPDVVLLVDADCSLGDRAVETLVARAISSNRPVQAAYLMNLPPNSGVRVQVSGFAFFFKNYVRPKGLAYLGLPCLLTGTGMAFPWSIISRAPLASCNIVEDLQLGLDLAVAGYPPRFCPQSCVFSTLPAGNDPAAKQRKRWEHGHLRTLVTQLHRLLFEWIRQRRLALLGLALELSIPPLSMLFLIWGLTSLGLISVGLWKGIWLPALLLTGSGLLAFICLLGVWFKFGQTLLPLTSLLAAPFYAIGKVPIYIGFFLRPERAWVRTARTNQSSEARDT